MSWAGAKRPALALIRRFVADSGMTFLRRVVRAARPAIETVVAGALLGAVVAVFVAQAAGSSSQSATQAEVPVARAYMLALVHSDVDAMAQLSPSVDPVNQAIYYQQLADAFKTAKVESLTYLGGATLGGLGIHVYVVQAKDESGEHLLPFTLTVYQGNIVRVVA
jgi:hypothetical protein